MDACLQKILVAISMLLLCSVARAQVDYGYMYPPNVPNEQSMEGLPYAIPCAKAKNQYGLEFYRCTWFALPRNITQWNPQQQRNVIYSNQLSGTCKRGKCFVANESGLYGMYSQDISFSLSIYYYIYESKDGYPVAYLMSGGPNKSGRAVSYSEARSILQEFLLERGVRSSTVGDNISKYDLDQQASTKARISEASVLSSKPAKSAAVTQAWCNPRADDECTINGAKVAKSRLGDYLPKAKVDDVEQAGGYCEYPICYDKDDKPVGVN